MSLARIASYIFLASLFGVVAMFGYLPSAWAAGWPVYTLFGVAAVSLVMWGVFSLELLALWLKKRSTQFGISMTLTAVAAIAILSVLNWFVVAHNKKWDVTANKMHTLSDQSRKIAKGLTEKITIRVWSQNVQAMSANIDLKNFLENYKIAGGGKINIEFKNPINDRSDSLQDNLKRDNVIIVRSESGRESRIENYADNKAEELITNGIIQAVKGGKKTVCFLAGHGEGSINSKEPRGLSMVRDSLSDSSYTPREFTLAEASKSIPTECEAVIVVGPQGDASEQETSVLMDYVKGGGKMLVLLGAGTPEHWRKFAGAFGVEVNQDYLLDLGSNPVSLVATKNYSQDVEIVKGFEQLVLLMDSSSLRLPAQTQKGAFEVKSFVSSRDRVISIEGDIRKMKEIRPKASDFKGPLPLAVLITRPADSAAKPSDPDLKDAPPADDHSASGWNDLQIPGFIATAHAQEGAPPATNPAPTAARPAPQAPTEMMQKIGTQGPKANLSVTPTTETAKAKPDGKMALIVMSNSLFPINAYVQQYGNMDFFLNTVSFLLKDSDLIGIRPRDLRQASLELTNERMRQVVATIFIISGLFLVGGISSRRRKSA